MAIANSTQEKLASGDQVFAGWISDVRGLLGNEFDAAADLFSFAEAFRCGLTPAKAVAEYDAWVSE